MTLSPTRLGAMTAACLVGVSLAGCVPNSTDSADAIEVVTDGESCDVATAEAGSGTLHFTVQNDGDEVTEFYLLGEDKLRIVGEVENIGAGLTRELTVQVPPGDYFTACKPNMVGDGIGMAAFTVTDSGEEFVTDENTQALIDQATTAYAAYVKDQTAQLLEGTQAFADAYLAGDDDTARGLYASTRMHWERIETVAESFGDLDPRLDAREADLEPGEDWTGWHAIEKDLWPQDAEADFTAYTPEQRQALADQLVADTEELNDRVQDLTYTLDQLTNGAIGLLDEVATGKVTGEEEIWSHTDLWDFQANVDGAVVLYQGVREILVAKDEDLADTLDAEFEQLQTLLDAQREGDGFRLYTDLSEDDIRALSDQVNALSEPLSKLTSTLLA